MRVPRHVAAIQDGNRRFAERRGEKPYKGHQEGVGTTRRFLRWCSDLGVDEVTVYALSTENFGRDEEELDALFDLLEEEFLRAARDPEVHENGMRIRGVGARELLPTNVKEALEVAERETAHLDDCLLNVAVGYGGRRDLAATVRRLAEDADDGARLGDAVEELGSRLMPSGGAVSDVELLIRTGGEKRISNFLPWQASGNECLTYFTEKMWPEFGRDEFERALEHYGEAAESERRVVMA